MESNSSPSPSGIMWSGGAGGKLIVEGLGGRVDSEAETRVESVNERIARVTQKRLTECANCARPAGDTCTDCGAVVYCGRECQKQDWARHQLICARLGPGLLGIRIVHNPDMYLLDCPLCKAIPGKVEVVCSDRGGENHESLHVHHYDECSPSAPSAYLQTLSKGEPIHVDCSLFIQLVMVSQGHILGAPGTITFGIGGVSSWLALAPALKAAELQPGYYTPIDLGRLKQLRRFAPEFSGHWLAGPDKELRFLGMSFADGPVRKTLREWHEELVSSIRATFDERRIKNEAGGSPEAQTRPENGMMECLEAMLLDKDNPIEWGLHREPVDRGVKDKGHETSEEVGGVEAEGSYTALLETATRISALGTGIHPDNSHEYNAFDGCPRPQQLRAAPRLVTDHVRINCREDGDLLFRPSSSPSRSRPKGGATRVSPAMAANGDLPGRCGCCGAPAHERCARCKRVHYCSREHQKQHWAAHKQVCRCLAVARAGSPL